MTEQTEQPQGASNVVPFKAGDKRVIRSKVANMTATLSFDFSTGEVLNINYCPNKFSYAKYTILRMSLDRIEAHRHKIEALRRELANASKALAAADKEYEIGTGSDENLKAIETDYKLALLPAPATVEGGEANAESQALTVQDAPEQKPDVSLVVLDEKQTAELERMQGEARKIRVAVEAEVEKQQNRITVVENQLSTLANESADQTGTLIAWLAEFIESWDMMDFVYLDDGSLKMEGDEPLIAPVAVTVEELERLGMVVLTPIITELLNRLTAGKTNGDNSSSHLSVVAAVDNRPLSS